MLVNFDQGRLPVSMLPPGIPGLGPYEQSWQAQAAVLLLFCRVKEDANAHIVFTKRSTQVKTHKGQIGFPGGHRDQSDADLADTAWRETEEELGIPRHRVSLHGCLPIVHTPDAKKVLPFVATTDMEPNEFKPSVYEVETIITLPWTLFQSDSSLTQQFVLFGRRHDTTIFAPELHKIWGLTAKILRSTGL